MAPQRQEGLRRLKEDSESTMEHADAALSSCDGARGPITQITPVATDAQARASEGRCYNSVILSEIGNGRSAQRLFGGPPRVLRADRPGR